MKIIKHLYENVAQVACSCCMENHYVKFDICKGFHTDEDKEALYITIKDTSPFSFKQRLGHIFKTFRTWKSNRNYGSDMADQGVLIHKEQLGELYSCLKEALLKYKILTDDDFEHIEKSLPLFLDFKYPIEWKGKAGISFHDYTWVPFVGDDFVISTMVNNNMELCDSNINFGYKFNDNIRFKDIRRYAFYHLFYKSNTMLGGDSEGFLNIDNTITLLKVLHYFSLHLKD